MITIDNKAEVLIREYLETHDVYILNERNDYNLASFKNCQTVYNKLSSMHLLFDWFPKLWSFVVYKNNKAKRDFLDNMYNQLGYDYQIHSFKSSRSYVYLNNVVEILYNDGTKDYIMLDT